MLLKEQQLLIINMDHPHEIAPYKIGNSRSISNVVLYKLTSTARDLPTANAHRKQVIQMD